MSNQKRQPGERERDFVDIANWYVRGNTLQQIADKLFELRGYRISRQQIHDDVKEIRAQWREDHTELMSDYMVRELAKLDRLETEYWNLFDASKGTRKEKTTKRGTNQFGAYDEDAVKEWESEGNPVYLAGIKDCIEKRGKLLGLFKQTIDLTSKGESINKRVRVIRASERKKDEQQ